MTEAPASQRLMGLHLVYEGTHFQGYQVQPQQRTVQLHLENALAKVLGHVCPTICAGRTDAGVHARAQFVHFQTPKAFPLERLPLALQRHLPADIAVLSAHDLSPGFHARYAALSRTYRYFIWPETRVLPFNARYCWHYPHDFDRNLLSELWPQLLGRHNFEAFCKSGSYRTNFIIEIEQARVLTAPNGVICLEIQAQSFLYNMVRTLVGTVLDIARGRFPAQHLAQILSSTDRALVGLTAPPQGLFLWNVLYPAQFGLDLNAEAEKQALFFSP
ncbi:MAG: tRNA pseudouridine(38-40) synthase TruA [Candidatus Sericytochromatia bacterium]